MLSGVHGETRTQVGVLLALADTTSGNAYTLSGNAFCAPNTPRVAGLSADPTSGVRPLTVGFDASSSSDGDPGDRVESYTFYFGDGSSPVTQSGPMISHRYARPGTYTAALTVTDARGQESVNASRVEIQVRSPATADVALVATGPSTGRVGRPISYSITVTNNGPSAASGVFVRDGMPLYVHFDSATVTQGTCALTRQATRQVVRSTIGTMASGATVRMTVTVTPPHPAIYRNTVRVRLASPTDPVPGNDRVILAITVAR